MKRASGAIAILLLAACGSTEGKLQDLQWGQEYEADYQATLERARLVLLKEFPKGLDPDRSNEEGGEFWTVWRYDKSEFYRSTQRARCRCKVEKVGENRVRVGVAVVSEINENIDNPSVIDEARWVNMTRNPDWEARIEQRILQRYAAFKPSQAYAERTAPEKSKTPRPDIADRYKDVDLENAGKIDPNREPIRVTGNDPGKEKPK